VPFCVMGYPALSNGRSLRKGRLVLEHGYWRDQAKHPRRRVRWQVVAQVLVLATLVAGVFVSYWFTCFAWAFWGDWGRSVRAHAHAARDCIFLLLDIFPLRSSSAPVPGRGGQNNRAR
jgi:hypothetical protein